MNRIKGGLWVAALALTTFAVAACGDDDDNGQQQGAEANCTVPADLRETTWVRCTDEDEGIARQITLDFGCSQITATEVFFEQAGCEGDAILTLTQSYGAQFGQEIEGSEGVRALDLTARTAVIRAENQSGADFLAETQFCGINAWEAGRDVDLYDRGVPVATPNCPIEPQNVEVYYSFRQAAGMLFFPEEEPTNDPNDRPAEVNEDGYEQRTF